MEGWTGLVSRPLPLVRYACALLHFSDVLSSIRWSRWSTYSLSFEQFAYLVHLLTPFYLHIAYQKSRKLVTIFRTSTILPQTDSHFSRHPLCKIYIAPLKYHKPILRHYWCRYDSFSDHLSACIFPTHYISDPLVTLSLVPQSVLRHLQLIFLHPLGYPIAHSLHILPIDSYTCFPHYISLIHLNQDM